MKTILEVEANDPEEARVLREILKEMGYKTSLYTRLDADDGRKTPASQTRLGELMVTYAKKTHGTGSFYVGDFEEILTAHRYSPSSAGPMLSWMVHEGVMERLGRGQYRLKEKQE